MISLTCIESYIDKENNCYGSFLIEPLDVGQGITLGNALRRTLLSDLVGYGITGVRINNVKHEFITIRGLREDILEILLNLKEIVFKASFSSIQKEKFHFKGFLNVQGPLIVTAGLLKLPKKELTILNPTQYICTIVEDMEFYLEIDIDAGIGYQLTEEKKRKNITEKFSPSRPSTLLVDGIFLPIRTVNYKVKLIHDTYGNIKESIVFEVVTNGSISPKRSIQEALKILVHLFLPLFSIPEFPNLISFAKTGRVKQKSLNKSTQNFQKNFEITNKLNPVLNEIITNSFERLQYDKGLLTKTKKKMIKTAIKEVIQKNRKIIDPNNLEKLETLILKIIHLAIKPSS